MYSQVDSERKQHLVMEEVSYHWKDNKANPTSEGTSYSYNWNKKPNIVTHRWEIKMQWKYGLEIWERLKFLKESNPIDLSKYAVGE